MQKLKQVFNEWWEGFSKNSDINMADGEFIAYRAFMAGVNCRLNIYGHKLKMIRIKLEYTQEAFAEFIGVSTRTIQRWEKSENIPRGKSVFKLDTKLKEFEDGL